MSYASELKKELCTIDIEKDYSKFELLSFIIFKSEISLSSRKFNIQFSTTSLTLSRRIINLFLTLYNINPAIISKKQDKLDYKDVYQIIVEDCEHIIRDLNMLETTSFFDLDNYKPPFHNEEEKLNYLRGAFLSRGSINDPNTNNYHLEIVCPNILQKDILKEILDEIDIKSSYVVRSKGVVLYIKKAECIGDFLRYVGATNMLFSYEDLRIKKDLNNYVNRITNCDVANEQKALLTAQKQLENIEIVLKRMRLEDIDERLLGVINLRNQNPDDTLSELSEKSEEEIGYYISKSGLSHRFKEIEKLAQELTKGNE